MRLVKAQTRVVWFVVDFRFCYTDFNVLCICCLFVADVLYNMLYNMWYNMLYIKPKEWSLSLTL